jgi:periplasmic mercuric ion binding protein
MRLMSFALMLVTALTFGCNKPIDEIETIPKVAPTSGQTGDSSGMTDGIADEHADHDHEHGDHDHNEGAAEGATSGEEDSAATGAGQEIRFVADTKLEIPGMMCPYACYPKVKETLAAQPGVEAVQLAEQPEGTPEGAIEKKVVELKLNDDFDSDAALAALKAAEFEGKLLN